MKAIYFLSVFFIALCVIFFSNCTKERQPVANVKPVFVVQAVTVYSDGGITLNGLVNALPVNLTEYGFLLSTDSTFSSPKKYKATVPAKLGAFQINVNAGFQKGYTYYVKAYSITNGSDFATYNLVSFKSSGSKNIVISSISPLKADLGDTLTIKGKYLLGQDLYMQFGSSIGSATILNDSVLTCTVPLDINRYTTTISIINLGVADTVTTMFSLNTPVITNFTAAATFRDTVVINGNYFGFRNSLNQVMIGNVAATIVSSSRTQLKVIVPDNVPHSFNTISVYAQAQTVSSATQFQITPPVITGVTPATGSINDPVTITGKYFHPVTSNNIVYSECNPVQLTGGTTTQLNYNIPNGPYPRGKATIKLELLDYTVTYSTDMIIH